MPRAPRLRIAALADLHRQLAYAPIDAKRRQLLACEALVDEIDSDRTYPEEFVRFRITGFRIESPTAPALLVGEPLRADLTTFILLLSEGLSLEPGDRAGGALPIDRLAARLGVALRTVQRWRQLGLVQHWIDFSGSEGGDQADGGRRIGCFEESLARFARRQPQLIDRQRRLTRLDVAERGAIVAAAHAEIVRGESISAVSRRVAKRSGRSAEAIRQILLRVEPAMIDRGAKPSGQLTERHRRLIERAWRRGVPLHTIARRLDRSDAAIQRQLSVRRRERLRMLRLRWIELPTFELPDAEKVILSTPAVRSGLIRLDGTSDATVLLRNLRGALMRTASERDALIGAWNLLRRRAATALAALPDVPRPLALDAIESDLRWATLVHHTLLAAALPDAIRRIDVWIGRHLETSTSDRIRALLELAVSTVVRVLDGLDPSRGQRLERVVGLETDKALAKLSGVEAQSTGARSTGADRQPRAALSEVRPVAIDDPFRALLPWQSWLDPPRFWRERLASLDDLPARAITMRHGLDATAPQRLPEIARALRVAVAAASRLVQEGEGRMRFERHPPPNSQ